MARDYLLHTPSSPVGLVVLLHGKGGTAEWADGETGWSALAGQENFALAIPEGLRVNPNHPSKFLSNPQYWNDGSETDFNEFKRLLNGEQLDSHEHFSAFHRNETPVNSTRDVVFLTAVIDDVAVRLGGELSNVFVTGFSNGAGMTFRFASERAERITAIAPVAGHCWVESPKPSRFVPTLYIVGAADPLIPFRGGDVRSPWTSRLVRRPPVSQTLERWARAIGCDIIPVLESEAAGVRTEFYTGPIPYRCVTIEGMGHHWPGGKGQLNPRIAGSPSNAFSATIQIWNFFRQFI